MSNNSPDMANSGELPGTEPAVTRQNVKPVEPDAEQQNTEPEQPAAEQQAAEAAQPAIESTAEQQGAEPADPLVPYPPEAYVAVGVNEYISDLDRTEDTGEAPEAASGNGGGNGPGDDEEDLEEKSDDPSGAPLTLTDHFRELRNRLIKIFLGITVGFLVCWGFSDILAEFLYLPLLRVLPQTQDASSSIIFTGVAEGFFTHMKIAVVGGIFVISPFIFYQIWSFIAPGLYDEEKTFVVPVAVCSAVCFIAGGCFCYFVVFPNAFRFFMGYSQGQFKAMPSMKEYFNFTMQLVLAFGMVFELPLFTFFLSRLGLVTAPMMRRFRRYFIVVAFILGAMLTPPDVISQLLMAAPMLVLYELSIIVAAIFGKKETAAKEQDKEDHNKDNEEDKEK